MKLITMIYSYKYNVFNLLFLRCLNDNKKRKKTTYQKIFRFGIWKQVNWITNIINNTIWNSRKQKTAAVNYR